LSDAEKAVRNSPGSAWANLQVSGADRPQARPGGFGGVPAVRQTVQLLLHRDRQRGLGGRADRVEQRTPVGEVSVRRAWRHARPPGGLA
jgi:hypothetical protein